MISVITIKGCARCWGAGHDQIVFRPFLHPVKINSGSVTVSLTHWAMCPQTGEPILMAVDLQPEQAIVEPA